MIQANSLYAYRTYSYSYSTVIFEPFFQNTVTVTQFQLYSDIQLFTVTKVYVRQWCTVILGQSLFLQKIRWNSCFLPKCTYCMDGIDSTRMLITAFVKHQHLIWYVRYHSKELLEPVLNIFTKKSLWRTHFEIYANLWLLLYVASIFTQIDKSRDHTKFR